MKPSQMFPLRVALSPERSEDHYRPSTEPAPASPDALSNLSHRNPATYGPSRQGFTLATHARHYPPGPNLSQKLFRPSTNASQHQRSAS